MGLDSWNDGALVVGWILVKEVGVRENDEWIGSIKKGRFFIGDLLTSATGQSSFLCYSKFSQ
jgi:hypothetical protein